MVGSDDTASRASDAAFFEWDMAQDPCRRLPAIYDLFFDREVAVARKSSLRAVEPDEKPVAPPKPLTLAEAIEAGVYLEILKAQRREMVRDVKDERGPAKAAMHRQIALLSKEIAGLDAEAKQEADEDAEGVGDEAFDPEAL